ncbi:MAG: penicillin-binding protein 1B [Desulfobulbaceae bacterium]
MSHNNLKTRWTYLAGGGIAVLLLFCALTALHAWHLNVPLQEKFDGRRWAIPARVYARPLELYPGKILQPGQLEMELQLAGYRVDDTLSTPGSYARRDVEFRIHTREFDFDEGRSPAVLLSVAFSRDAVGKIEDTASGKAVELARIDPALIGSFLPRNNEDRVLVTREELPDQLVQTLLAVEDRHFFSHHGLDPRGILRALWVNVRAGAAEQGGSTLTQQLVKSFFLTRERTLRRKFNEAVMALLLDWQYDKDEILTAYANEIFLGQDGSRAIHGFGLASQFYFQRSLENLQPQHYALLVGLIQAPSHYDPRRHPERSLQRRQNVLRIMVAAGIITSEEFRAAADAPLLYPPVNRGGFNRFPEFLELVRRQLHRDYREEDLTASGLKIFTTLDPYVQRTAEETLAETIIDLEKEKTRQGLEGAVLVTNRNNGEIEAVVGSRSPASGGFNRAMDAFRPIGSLVKPAVYLAALENGSALADMVDDTPLTWKNQDGSTWAPRNFDRKEHGRVTLYEALIYSYNLATIKLGLATGVDKVIKVLARLGYAKTIPPYPSLFVGALSLSPMEVTQIYQTLASEGFYMPLRAISRVVAMDNRPVQRFPLSVEQRVDPTHAFLLNTALQQVIREGTATSLSAYVPPSHGMAGKTGTSDDGRDSWFAAFSDDKLAVVWLGRDDNSPVNLTGSTGALVVWGKMMQQLHAQPLRLIEPPGIRWQRVSVGSNRQVSLPLIAGTTPAQNEDETEAATDNTPQETPKNPISRFLDWLF